MNANSKKNVTLKFICQVAWEILRFQGWCGHLVHLPHFTDKANEAQRGDMVSQTGQRD